MERQRPETSPVGLSARIVVVLIVAVFLGSTLSIPVASAYTGNGTSTPIKHLIVITMENHSFDNIFGKYPFNDGSSNQTLISSISRPVNLETSNQTGSMSAVSSGSFSTGNPQEGYSAYHLDWNHGAMNGFLNASGPNSMKYFTASQMAIEWDLAQQYSLGDMYFSSTLSETVPNRLYEIAGFSPVKNDYGPPPSIPLNQTIMHQLTAHNISWGYYIRNTSHGYGPLDVVHNINTYSGNFRDWNTFFSELSNNSIPSVSWLMPITGGGIQYSQHPSYSMLTGELWLLYVVDKVMNSPEWNSTAIMINYDEGGGYYDQVAPPTLDGQQLGFRVPFILISPYAKENYISSTVLSHTSTIAFIDYNWKLPALNRMVSESNLPLDFFNFNKTYPNGGIARGPLNLGSSINGLVPSTPAFSAGDYSTITNISSMYPMKFQIPLSEMPYGQYGSSNVTLQHLGSGIQVLDNFAYVPIYQSNIVIILATVIGSSSIYYVSRKGRNKGQ